MIRGKQKRLQVAGYRLQVTALRGETGTETLKLETLPVLSRRLSGSAG